MFVASSQDARDLVSRAVGGLGRAVGRAPAVAVATVVVLTGVLGVLSGQVQESADDAGMLPDAPEVAAAQVVSERFGGEDEDIVQVLVRTEGDGLVGGDGLVAAASLEEAIRASAAGPRIADRPDRPGVVSWLFPVQMAWGAEAARVDDMAVRATYAAAAAELSAEEAAYAAALLPTDARVTHADSALLFAFIDTSDVASPTELADAISAVVRAVEGAALPGGVTASVFHPSLLFDEAGFQTELGRLFGSAFGIIMVILGFVYWVRPGWGVSRVRAGRRSVVDMLLSMASIVMAILWMLGLTALLGPGYLGVIGGVNEFIQVIPVLLIGLGVDYAIHLTSRYREEVGAGADVVNGVRGAIATVGGALLLATVTTAVGFLTNIVNPIPDLRDFGIVAAVGIVAAFVVTLTFMPAARLLLDRRAERSGRLPAAALGQTSQRMLPGVMARTAVLATHAPVATLALTVVLAGVGVFGMVRLETRFSQTDFVATDSPTMDTITALTERFNGGYGETTHVLLSGPVATPDAHNALVQAHGRLESLADVAVAGDQVLAHSPVTLLAQLRASDDLVASAAADAGVGADLSVPAGADVAGLYAAMAAAAPEAARDVLATPAGSRFELARVVVQTTAGEERAAVLATELAELFAPLASAGVTAVATSSEIMSTAVVKAIENSQVSSLAITLLVAMLLLVAVFAYERRRPGLGVIAIVPVGLVVVWTFGMMAATGIPFGPITASIAALAIGIGLPYSIHVVHRFVEDRVRHNEVGDAIRSTVRHTGGAMAGSAFTTIAGFGILVTSSLLPFRQLGAVMVYAVGLSLVAATLVLPSILVLWDRWHQRRRATHVEDLRTPHELVAA